MPPSDIPEAVAFAVRLRGCGGGVRRSRAALVCTVGAEFDGVGTYFIVCLGSDINSLKVCAGVHERQPIAKMPLAGLSFGLESQQHHLA